MQQSLSEIPLRMHCNGKELFFSLSQRACSHFPVVYFLFLYAIFLSCANRSDICCFTCKTDVYSGSFFRWIKFKSLGKLKRQDFFFLLVSLRTEPSKSFFTLSFRLWFVCRCLCFCLIEVMQLQPTVSILLLTMYSVFCSNCLDVSKKIFPELNMKNIHLVQWDAEDWLNAQMKLV